MGFWGKQRGDGGMKIFDYLEKKLESEEGKKTAVEVLAILTSASLAFGYGSALLNGALLRFARGMDRPNETQGDSYKSEYMVDHLLRSFVEGFDNDEIILGEFEEELLPLDRPFTITYDDEGRKMVDGEYVTTKATPTMIFVDYYNDDSGESRVRKQVLKIDDEYYQKLMEKIEDLGQDDNIVQVGKDGISYILDDDILEDAKYQSIGKIIDEAVKGARFLEYQNTDESMER